MQEFTSKWQNFIMGALAVLVLLYGTYNYIYKPKLKEINDLKNSLKMIDNEIITIEGGNSLLKDLNAAKVLLKKELDELATKIPSEKDTPYLINNYISVVGKGLNIDYNLIQPSGLEDEQKYKRLPLKVEFVGDYADLNSYLAQLKKLPVTIRVDAMELRKVAGENRLTIGMTLSAFVMPGGSEKLSGGIKGYSYMFDPFYVEEKVTEEVKPEGIKALRYSGYFKGREIKAIINDEPMKVGESIQGYRISKIYKDRVTLIKDKKSFELYLEEK